MRHLRSLRPLAALAPLAIATLGLSACSDDAAPVTATPAPTPAPTPTPTPTTANFDVTRCLNQVIPGTGGTTVAAAVVPDVLTLNLAGASGFPNGRRLADPVIDVTLNIIFLDLTRTGAGTLAGVPVNPSANDVAFRTTFPYLAPPQGTPPLAATTGTSFNFRTDPASAYTRVDRMGMPAVATALIGSAMKNAYNDANPSNDAAGQFVPELGSQLTGLTNALADDFTRLGLPLCATPR